MYIYTHSSLALQKRTKSHPRVVSHAAGEPVGTTVRLLDNSIYMRESVHI